MGSANSSKTTNWSKSKFLANSIFGTIAIHEITEITFIYEFDINNFVKIKL